MLEQQNKLAQVKKHYRRAVALKWKGHERDLQVVFGQQARAQQRQLKDG